MAKLMSKMHFINTVPMYKLYQGQKAMKAQISLQYLPVYHLFHLSEYLSIHPPTYVHYQSAISIYLERDTAMQTENTYIPTQTDADRKHIYRHRQVDQQVIMKRF